ncbi:MAG TPA: hypothetical protein VEF55_02255 [Candidatus Binatia bacterium]|nr:hypothetical protein [Candidatus Binatia bacterium]
MFARFDSDGALPHLLERLHHRNHCYNAKEDRGRGCRHHASLLSLTLPARERVEGHAKQPSNQFQASTLAAIANQSPRRQTDFPQVCRQQALATQ